MESTTTTPATLTAEQIDYRVFNICKSIANIVAGKKKVYTSSDTFSNLHHSLRKAGLHDEDALLKILTDRIQENNSRIEGDYKKINNLKHYRNWRDSIYIRRCNIKFHEIEKAVKENPAMDSYDIYRTMFRDKY